MRRVRYGPSPSHFADVRVPLDASGTPPAVVVLVHGGFWKRSWHADLMNTLAVWLTQHGVASWNVEYRRVGMHGSGDAGCVADVIAAVDSIDGAGLDLPIDASRVVLAGHSAGGHLALLAAARSTRRPLGVVGLAAVSDLVAAAQAGLGDRAAQALVRGEPDELRERYRELSPIDQLPLGVPQLLVHGVRDQAVPVSMSSLYAQKARAMGDDVELDILPATGHAELIDPALPVWPERIFPWIVERLTSAGDVL